MEALRRQWENLPQWQKIVVLLVLPLLVSVYMYFMLVSPLKDQVERNRSDLERLKSDVENLKRLSSPETLNKLRRKEEELIRQRDQAYEELSRTVGFLPTEKNLSEVFRIIGSLAKKNGLVIQKVSIENPQDVRYILENNIVKEEKPQPQQPSQQQQQQQPPSQQQAKSQQAKSQQQQQKPGVSFKKSDLTLSVLGNYSGIKGFLIDLQKFGIVSYPKSLSLSSSSNKVNAEIKLTLVLKKEEGGEKK